MPQNSKRTLRVLAAAIGAFALVAVGATSTSAAAPDVFSIATLTTDNAVWVDPETPAGDDDGFLGVTGTKFLFSGDDATVAYDLADMGNPYVTDVNNGVQDNNWLFSDLKTQTSYYFVADQIGGAVEYDITGFQPLDQTGDLDGAVIPLSESVTINNDLDDCTIFASGFGRVAIWDGCLGVIYDIELPTGIVTTVTGVATFADYDASIPLLLDWYETDTGVSQLGVVEYDGSALHVVAVAATSDDYPRGIYRFDVQNPTAAPTQILEFGPDYEGADYADIWKFTVSPATNQWCSGAEDGWAAISGDADVSELAFCATATFSFTSPKPALAATGIDTSGYLVAGGAVLLGGLALVLVARRRSATS